MREIGDRVGEAQIAGNFGLVYQQQGQYAEAVACYECYLDISRGLGFVVGEIEALCCLGSGLGQLCNYDVALEHLRKHAPLPANAASGELDLQPLNGLGTHGMSRYATALSARREALSVAVELEDRYHLAHANHGIAQRQVAEGDSASTREHWQRALKLHTELGTPESAVIAARLDAAGRMAPERRSATAVDDAR